MHAVDVNVLVFAHRPDADGHSRYRDWLEAARLGEEPLGVSDVVLSGFVRIVTHPRVFKDPSPLEVAVGFADMLRASPASVPLRPGPRHWGLFTGLCQQTGARGNLVPDAFLAALAIESGATWMTADRGFARFAGLRWAHPLD